jgi:YD repeat-containing protein
VFEGGTWRLRTKNGWTYFFPYRPKAYQSQVTVLTGFVDPQGRKYEMVRDATGDLLSLATPSGQWLHFKHDEQHRIVDIEDSKGRSVRYEYNATGQLIRVSDSSGSAKSYTYNDRNEMLSVAEDQKAPLLTNRYTSSNLIASQTLADGRRFEYSYSFGAQMVITQNLFKDPNGLVTYFDYDGQGRFLRSLPTRPPQ